MSYLRNPDIDLFYDQNINAYVPSGYNVIAISRSAFLKQGYLNPNISSIDMKDTPVVGNTMYRAFYSSGNAVLNSVVNINNSVTNMSGTFYNCQNFTMLDEFPTSVTDLDSCFYNTKILISPIIPNSVTNMRNTFCDCVNLGAVPQMPNSVVYAESAFKNAINLTSYSVLSTNLDPVVGLTSTFYGSGITNLPTIPNSITDLNSTFANCCNLVNCYSMPLPNSIVNMPNTFANCTNLTVTPSIPNSVEDMTSTFEGCRNLTNVTSISANVVSLNSTFANCSSLTKERIPTIPTSVTDMVETFAYCNALVSTPTLPNNVENVTRCFMGCVNLQSVSTEIPSSVTNIRGTFDGCTNLTGTISINAQEIRDVRNCFANTTASKNVFIPFTYSNSVHTKTYNTFVEFGYDNVGTKDGVYLKDIDNKVTITVNPIPSDATVTFNVPGYTQAGNMIEVPIGVTVQYTVSKQYYVSASDTFVATEDVSIPVIINWDCYVPQIGEFIANLSGSTKSESDTRYVPGLYEIDVAAGGEYAVWSNGYNASKEGGRVTQIVNVTEPFIVRAYCGSRGTSDGNNGSAGTNPYSGPFKVNGLTTNGTPATVNHIFGNAGSVSMSSSGPSGPSGGNCLGNGAFAVGTSTGAGSCLHLMPIGGTFGTDYLFAFHTTGASCEFFGGASGSAYGGAGSGASLSFFGESTMSSSAGGSTPYGTGGAGVNNAAGRDGTGPGYGKGSGIGAAAWFDGTSWLTSNISNNKGEDGFIKVKYLGQ